MQQRNLRFLFTSQFPLRRNVCRGYSLKTQTERCRPATTHNLEMTLKPVVASAYYIDSELCPSRACSLDRHRILSCHVHAK